MKWEEISQGRSPPKQAKALWDRFEFVYTPKHGSWLNIAEIELSVLNGQCLNRRIDDIEIIRKEVSVWQNQMNINGARVRWQFTAEDARIKLHRLYPTVDRLQGIRRHEGKPHEDSC